MTFIKKKSLNFKKIHFENLKPIELCLVLGKPATFQSKRNLLLHLAGFEIFKLRYIDKIFIS